MSITLSALQKQRRDTAANWTAENPTLLAGEIGIESDTGKIKIGNGSTAWASLGYQGIIPSSGTYPLSQLLMPSGTASAPSISFDGDTNTGVYRTGADQLALATGGSGRLFVDASGNVGVGAAPAWPVHIVTTVNDSFFLERNADSVGTPNLGFRTTRGTYASPTALLNGDGIGTIQFRGYTGTASSTGVGLRAVVEGTPSGSRCPAYFSVLTDNGTALGERLRITSAGRVGIGTTSPGSLLSVGGGNIGLQSNGSTGERTTERLVLRSDIGSVNGLAAIGLNGAGASGFLGEIKFYTGSADLFNTPLSERARIDSSGRLLVGTSTARANFYNSTNSAQFQVEGSGEVSIVRNSNDIFASSIVLGKSRSSTNAIVQSDDVIGILSFQGNDATEFVSAASISVNVDGTPGTNDMPGRIVLSTTADGASSPTERMRIQSDGAINLKTSTIAGNDGVRFNVGSIVIAGSAWNSGAGTNAVKWSSVSGALTWDSSSRLVKEDIENCPYGLSELKMLKPRIYTRTDSGEKEIGFIADEVQSIIPEIVPTGPKSCITGNEDDAELIPISVNYDKFAAVLTKALQDAIGEIESLKARITALETP